MSITKAYLDKLCSNLYGYFVEDKLTIRQAARKVGYSRSSVHKHIHTSMKTYHPDMYEEVVTVLEYNKAVRHIRGGEATRVKYSGSHK